MSRIDSQGRAYVVTDPAHPVHGLVALDPDGDPVALAVDADGKLKVDVSSVTVSNVEISNDVGNPIPVNGVLVTVSTEITRPTDTTAYTANDIVSNATSGNALITLSSVVRANGGSGYITGIRLSTNKKSITPRFRVHFFNASDPTFVGDNVPHKELYADAGKRLGYYDLPAMATAADSTNSDMSRAIDLAVRFTFVAAAATTNIYALLETLDAFTPNSGQKFNLTVTVDRN